MTLEDTIRAIVRDELARSRPSNVNTGHITVAAYAAKYTISERTVRDAIRDNRLEHVRIGRAVRVAAEARIQPRVDQVTQRARLVLMKGRR